MMATLIATRPKSLLYLPICLLLVISAVLKAGDPFTIVALPDTQHYTDNPAYIQHFYNQTQWVVDNIAAENIAFMTHLGDVTESGNDPTEWEWSVNALNTLEGGDPANTAYLPYSVTRGNHDGVARFTANMGASRYADESWYGGASWDNLCHYQTFSAGGYNFLHLNLTFDPSAGHLAWAQGIIDSHPNMPTILTTHDYLTKFLAWGKRSATGDEIWNGLVNNNPQIFMALCGHIHNEHQQLSVNAAGENVIEMMADYQSSSEGGMGYLRKIEFDVPNNKINVSTYSPSLDSYRTDSGSQFRYDVTFGATEITVNGLMPPEGTYVFRDGFNGYSETQDTEIRAASPDSSYGSESQFRVDAVDGDPAGPVQSLLRFDDVIGTEEGRISPTTGIVSATLTLNVSNAGSGATVHRMLTPWDESSTWNSLGAGVRADGLEAVATAEATLGADDGNENVPAETITIDVTKSLLHWQAGEENFGWLLSPHANGTDDLGFNSSESPIGSTLTVVTLPEGVRRTRFQDGFMGYDGTADTTVRQGDPTTADGDATTGSVDTDTPEIDGDANHMLIRFEDLFGDGPGQVPLSAHVLSATLVLNLPEKGGGFSMIHRMLQDWTEADTWDSLLDGISADDIEARSEQDCIISNMLTGAVEADVTESVLAWLSGEANYGWVLLPYTQGSNRLDVYTSEAGMESPRPMLHIDFTTPEPTSLLVLTIGATITLRRCRRV
ncbi:MAG: DNRLRE domain-containing protein [Phycisphaerae bacterium]|nr:DNRLRE domain-containing protein [Phycisphaerae bacterium]